MNQLFHGGWRQSLGIFLIVFALASAGLYYGTAAKQGAVTADNFIEVTNNPTSPKPSISASVVPTSVASLAPQSGKIHLLTATEAQLETLPKIGAVKAQAIIDYRNTHHIKSVNDLDNVKGIGPATINLLRPLVDL